MLEAYSAADVEEALRARGFFEGGAQGLVADIYLGYALSDGLRRSTRPAPPEPCALPPAAVHVRRVDEAPPRGGAFRIGNWETTWSGGDYGRAIESVRDSIAKGDVYQVNLVQHLSAPFRGDPAGLASPLAQLHPLEPRPFLGEGWAVVS